MHPNGPDKPHLGPPSPPAREAAGVEPRMLLAVTSRDGFLLLEVLVS